MSEQESSPELQAAREDVMKRFAEATERLAKAALLPDGAIAPLPNIFRNEAEEVSRLRDEAQRLGIAQADMHKIWEEKGGTRVEQAGALKRAEREGLHG